MTKARLRHLPSIDFIMNQPNMVELSDDYSRDLVRDICRNLVDQVRADLQTENQHQFVNRQQITEWIITEAKGRLKAFMNPHLRPVINATGIVLHTGLGRAPFSERAQENIMRVMQGYSNVELDLETGKRGERTDHVRAHLCRLTGAEDALVVNNNAAAVLLAMNTLAFGKEAIISRGQLIEIGGSFRLPDVMEKSGVLMREVGTTNKTKLSDYEQAITNNTGLIVVAHTSNYRVMGFTADVDLKELCDMAHQHHIPVLHDLGAGVIIDFEKLGLPYEPLVQESLNAGADVVTFSGDKVIGGPQSGLVVGKTKWLQEIHKNPIMRAVRCDKLIYAALEETLKLFYRPNDLVQKHKTLALLTEQPESIKQRAKQLLKRLSLETKKRADIRIEPCAGQTGSGALPLEQLPSIAVVIRPKQQSVEQLALSFRQYEPPVIGYIKDDALYLDMRTVSKSESKHIANAMDGYFKS